ncbi:endonuclease/exonuclease/phosphatase family protein [Candidatus Daviesbacteria bacterium]|nr:endonuclease/exonuclease/phosphatase family protein [Candidatus Daviesbacteria bacterium]
MRVKVISLNVWNGGEFFERIVDFVKKENPDIVALQEVYDGRPESLEKKHRTRTELKKSLNFLYESYAPAYLETLSFGQIPSGNLVLSKFPITKSDSFFYDIPFRTRTYTGKVEEGLNTPRNLQYCLIEVKNTQINLFNTQGIWGTDGLDNERRLKMADLIVSKIKDKSNVILCGDSNVTQKTQTILKIEKYLKNVFKGELNSTFNLKIKKGGAFAKAVVDILMISPNIKVLEHSCPNTDISDHLPLVATLEI